jgi:hypothetical protein
MPGLPSPITGSTNTLSMNQLFASAWRTRAQPSTSFGTTVMRLSRPRNVARCAGRPCGSNRKIARRVGAAVERALQREQLDRAARVAAARIGHELRVDVGDARREADRFRAEFRHRNFVYGEPPRVCRSRRAARATSDSCDGLGVMTFAITCGATAPRATASGAWPKPSMP